MLYSGPHHSSKLGGPRPPPYPALALHQQAVLKQNVRAELGEVLFDRFQSTLQVILHALGLEVGAAPDGSKARLHHPDQFRGTGNVHDVSKPTDLVNQALVVGPDRETPV